MNISSNVNSLMANQTYMNNNASNIANVNTQDYKATQTTISSDENGAIQAQSTKTQSETDLSKELTDQIIIENVQEANVNTIKTQDQMTGSLLDIKV